MEKWMANLYHTKWRSWEEGIERQHVLATRRSEHSKKWAGIFIIRLMIQSTKTITKMDSETKKIN